VEFPRVLWCTRYGTPGNKIRGLAGTSARSTATRAFAEKDEGLTGGGLGRLGHLHIESVDLLDAGVADKQRRSVWGEAAPVSEGSSGRLKPFRLKRRSSLRSEICTRKEPSWLSRMPSNTNSAHPGTTSDRLRKSRRARPFLSGEIKKHKLERIQRNGRNVASVRGPAWRIEAVGFWQLRGFPRLQIEDVDR